MSCERNMMDHKLELIEKLPDDMSPGELYSAILSLVADGEMTIGIATSIDFDDILRRRSLLSKKEHEKEVKRAICDALRGDEMSDAREPTLGTVACIGETDNGVKTSIIGALCLLKKVGDWAQCVMSGAPDREAAEKGYEMVMEAKRLEPLVRMAIKEHFPGSVPQDDENKPGKKGES